MKNVWNKFHLESRTGKESKWPLYKVNEHMLWQGTLYEHYLFFNIMQMHFKISKIKKTKYFLKQHEINYFTLIFIYEAYNKQFDYHINK